MDFVTRFGGGFREERGAEPFSGDGARDSSEDSRRRFSVGIFYVSWNLEWGRSLGYEVLPDFQAHLTAVM